MRAYCTHRRRHVQKPNPRWVIQSPLLISDKETPQNSNVSVAELLCVWSVRGADKAVHSFPPNIFFFWFYFSLRCDMTGPWKVALFLSFFSVQVNYTKRVFDVWNPICISSIVSSSYCGILKVRSERPFDKYRKTFWLYYTAFHLLSCRG